MPFDITLVQIINFVGTMVIPLWWACRQYRRDMREGEAYDRKLEAQWKRNEEYQARVDAENAVWERFEAEKLKNNP